MKKKRLLIFVIAYYAEDTLQSVLERIPRAIFEDYAHRNGGAGLG